jgi:ribosomal protein S18 acetylase RimI-like enzyme
MKHVLDNPAWNALISGNKHLAIGNGPIRHFDKEVSPFAAMEENTEENFKLLHDRLAHQGPILFVTPTELGIPPPWRVLSCIKGLQMINEASCLREEVKLNLEPLTKQHVPQMLELIKLTNPGPFASRTVEFGHYYGVFDQEQLVAMAGQRLYAFGHAEISAVCTHPDHSGKGYARQLLLNQLQRIQAASEIPFLHVRYDNERAVGLYESLGFGIRTEVYFYVMNKS